MTYLAIGAGFVLLLMVGARLFLSADPVLLGKILRWSLILGGLFFAFFLIFRGQALLAAAPAAVAAIAWRVLRIVPMGLWFRLFQMGRARSRQRQYAASRGSGAESAESSTVESAWLRMSLNHATGDLSGEVVRGSFSGQSLDALDEKALHRLLEECRADSSSMQLLESYMDRRLGPAWRESFAGGGSAWKANNEGIDRDEAYEILGLTPGASRAD
ncbi:MAG TPA: hypothetical protein EYM43_03955, partial [Alphaproteobacteria bacterium]|nr:hypothetical protein [Alphaproteobacteria bacterium]